MEVSRSLSKDNVLAILMIGTNNNDKKNKF